MAKKRRWSKFDEKASMMPPLRHSTAEPFDIMRSEVSRWLCSQPEFMQLAFDIANNHGAIAYDEQSGTWEGIDHHGN